jgi:hypothetical protein
LVVKGRTIRIPAWGVRLRADPTFLREVGANTAWAGGPDLGTPTAYQVFSAYLTFEDRETLYVRLMRTWEKAPRSLAEAAKGWPGRPLKPDRKAGNVFMGLRVEEVRGPATTITINGRRRQLHLFYATLTAERWLLMPDGGTTQCHLSWTGPLPRVEEIQRHRFFRRYLRLCRSLRRGRDRTGKDRYG